MAYAKNNLLSSVGYVSDAGGGKTSLGLASTTQISKPFPPFTSKAIQNAIQEMHAVAAKRDVALLNKLRGADFDNAVNQFLNDRQWTKEDQKAMEKKVMDMGESYLLQTQKADFERSERLIQQQAKRIECLERLCIDSYAEAGKLTDKCKKLEAEIARLKKQKRGPIEPIDDETWRRAMRYG